MYNSHPSYLAGHGQLPQLPQQQPPVSNGIPVIFEENK